MRSLWICFLISLLSLVSARLVNITIDDASPMITYFPADGWSLGPTCKACTASSHIDKTQVQNQTWHDGTSNMNGDKSDDSLRAASLSFNGTEIYVFCILANTEQSPNGFSEMYFLIDGQVAGTFNHTPSPTAPTFQYNVTVFAAKSLPLGPHTLTIQNGHIGGPKSLVLLDYLIYSYDDGNLEPSPTSTPDSLTHSPLPSASSAPAPTTNSTASESTSSDSTGKIVGAVLGTIASLLLILVGFLWYRQRNIPGPIFPVMAQRSRTQPKESEPTGPWFASILRTPRPVDTSSPTHATNPSTFSFNPSMLVRPIVKRSRTLLFRPPPAIVTIEPLHPPAVDKSPSNSLYPLHPNRTPSPSPSLDPRTAPTQPMSIQQWQQRTYREAQDIPPRLSVAEVDLSSYWEMSSSAEPQPMRTPQRPAPIRRFTVVNN